MHSVETKYVNLEQGPAPLLIGTQLTVFDMNGYVIEGTFYEPDGSVSFHQVLIRKGDHVLESHTTGSLEVQNRTEQNFFDADGRLSETDIYDGNGKLLRRTVNEAVGDNSGIAWRTREIDETGKQIIREARGFGVYGKGVYREVETINNKAEAERQYEFDQDGTLLRQKFLSNDGSYNSSEFGADGWATGDSFSAATNTHTVSRSRNTTTPDMEMITESENSFRHLTVHHDDFGRATEDVSYGKNGEILEKHTIDYVSDEFGNWVESTTTSWSVGVVPTQKVSLKTFRRIVYY